MVMVASLKIFTSTIGSAVLLAACAVQPTESPPAQQPTGSILISSSPAVGSTVREPVDSLELQFDPPARLDEVTMSGPAGKMPMMVHAVGEVARYSLPLSVTGPGRYRIEWRAMARGNEYRGSFEFTVRG